MVVGLTGKYCSGKNLAGRIFSEKGWIELDVDRFGHEALKIKSAEVIKAFGNNIVAADGTIDRKKLGTIVFNDRNQLRLLESIIHPEMVEMCSQEIERNKDRPIVINAAVLHRMKLNFMCDSILWIKAGIWSRFRRARLRDHLSTGQIFRRIFSQHELDAKYWPEDVDIHIIQNRNSRAHLEVEICDLIARFEERV